MPSRRNLLVWTNSCRMRRGLMFRGNAGDLMDYRVRLCVGDDAHQAFGIETVAYHRGNPECLKNRSLGLGTGHADHGVPGPL